MGEDKRLEYRFIRVLVRVLAPQFITAGLFFAGSRKRSQCFPMKTKEIVRLSVMAMLSAISLLLVLLIRIPMPGATFLVYDMADVPVLIGSMLYGPIPGLIILLVVSVVQAFTLGGNGWVGLVMHFIASGAMVMLVSLFYRRRRSLRHMAIGMVLGTLVMALIMIPMNLIFTVHVFGAPHDYVVSLLAPVIVPFNLGKAGINCLLAGLLFRALFPFLRKNSGMLELDWKEQPSFRRARAAGHGQES